MIQKLLQLVHLLPVSRFKLDILRIAICMLLSKIGSHNWGLGHIVCMFGPFGWVPRQHWMNQRRHKPPRGSDFCIDHLRTGKHNQQNSKHCCNFHHSNSECYQWYAHLPVANVKNQLMSMCILYCKNNLICIELRCRDLLIY